MQQVHLFISGEVQGVGFREYVSHKARKVGVQGWVRNLDDGRVEAVIQGDEKKVEILVTLSQHGPPLAHVMEIDMQYEEIAHTYTDFIVVQ